jgi:hypothetical protein
MFDSKLDPGASFLALQLEAIQKTPAYQRYRESLLQASSRVILNREPLPMRQPLPSPARKVDQELPPESAEMKVYRRNLLEASLRNILNRTKKKDA